MKAQQILLQLFDQLPNFTDFFSTNISITDLSLSSLIVTATTASPHGFSIGNTVNISGAIIKNPLVSLTRVGNVVTGVTQYDHDLTEVFIQNIEITGAVETDYNGIFELESVPNRRTFTYRISTTPTTPATGDIFLIENDRTVNPYNGIKLITDVPSDTTFTYEISSDVYSPPSGDIVASSALRIGGAMSYEKAEEWYSKQGSGKYWLFVVLGDSTASKDRYNLDDATATTAINNRFRQRVITPFSFYVFAPLKDDTSVDGVNGRALRDSMEDVFYALCKSVLRKRFSTNFSEEVWSEVTFVNHGFYGYNQAYYVHQYTFEASFDVTFCDTIDVKDNVAFRDVEISFQKLDSDYIIATLGVNLDDVPL